MKSFYFLFFTFFSILTLNAQTVVITAQADNSIYEDAPTNSNGKGQNLFTGTTNFAPPSPRRALLKFDLSVIPAGAVFSSATLTLNMNKSRGSATTVKVHKLLSNWGEGASNAGTSSDGAGISALVSDATWPCSFADGVGGCTTAWTVSGGDYTSTASASTIVGPSIGNYTWTSTQIKSDVQNWHNTPASNFGWIVIGDEVATGSANRFASRENATIANRPTLTVTYSTLPVTLSSFEGEHTKNGNKLFWVTAQEINNAFFVIEHSLDGVNFLPIGKIIANGSTTVRHTYSFLHKNVLEEKNFYRLAQTDFDGRINYSSIITLSNKINSSFFNVFPNPVKDKIILKKFIVSKGNKYFIVNNFGNTVLAGVLNSEIIDVHMLASGYYFIRIQEKNNNIIIGKFIK
ncbi:MAG: T9SS type A sorting domain-containing protein [Ferruginibacter sp.]|nr:T9SS type A sorting domain-containing protein [Ferruginibacter sp.]